MIMVLFLVVVVSVVSVMISLVVSLVQNIVAWCKDAQAGVRGLEEEEKVQRKDFYRCSSLYALPPSPLEPPTPPHLVVYSLQSGFGLGVRGWGGVVDCALPYSEDYSFASNLAWA